MYATFVNYLRGSELFECRSDMPERLINLCAARNIPFWDVRWLTPEQFTFRTTRWGAAQLRRGSEELDVQLRRLDERGMPVTLRRVRYRYVLLAAAGLLAAALWLSSTFIWRFEVTGNETVSAQTILRVLEKNGVRVGTRALDIDQETLRNHVLLELHDISWLAVNVKGCTAHVQVVERHRPPKPLPDGATTNVVARRDGLVMKVIALDGRAMVTKGDIVFSGQLLISGVLDSPSAGLRLTQGMGKVYGRTWYELSTLVPLQAAEKAEISSRTTKIALDWGKRRIKLYAGGSMLPADCDKITEYKQLTLPFDFCLPVTLAVEKTISYTTQAETRTAAQARQEGEAQLLHQLDDLLADDAQITSTRFAASSKGDYLLVTLSAECYEQLGVTVTVEQASAASGTP